MLRINRLYKKFDERIILNHVSLNVPDGSIAVLLGSSGVGKSTLLRILNNLDSLDAGNVYLNDTKLDLENVNKTHTIGMVFQQFNLFEHLTAEENIMLALEKVVGKSTQEARLIAHEALKKYGLFEKANCYPSQLSGGQKQRLAIARLIALKPRVICLDEPTSALDPLLTNFVAQTIQELAHDGYTVLVATHDVAILEKLNCMIYLMRSGKIIESAPSTEFLAHRNQFPAIKKFVEGSAHDS
jgi:polar amino acid transport system ATP-binding protein